MQAVTVWLQYITLLGGINLPLPATIHWVFSIAAFAFSSITSGSLSTDCLLQSGTMNTALKRYLLKLAVPPLILLVLILIQIAR